MMKLHDKGWIPVSGHWDDIILFSGFQTGMTAVLRHTVTVSLDPANKQRDDGCQGVSYSGFPDLSNHIREN
ncbi:MAG: hypothetical protein ABS808_04850 [Wolbachia endosymbiont of Polyergus mexicanus]|jgi:hypothetical protein|uniref:Uncharacterized protein n=1 Tax=Wolbachia endosymbiont of Polyergus mexicanus TaxID=3171167 RepID=A0AAU7YHM1_9RICK